MPGPAKSGFAAGRSSNGTARSSMSGTRKPTAAKQPAAKPKLTKEQRMQAKVQRAQEELREIIHENNAAPWDDDDRPAGTLLGTALAVPPGGGGPDTGFDELQTKINAKFYGLRDYIGVENDAYNAEAASRLLLRTILSTMLELIPEAVHTYRKTHKEQAGYVVAAFATQARDVNTELRMVSDAENQADFIRDRIIKPVFLGFANVLLAEGMALRDELNKQLGQHARGVPIRARLDTMMTNLGAFMDASNAMMVNNTASYLNGDTSFLQSDTAGGKQKRGRRREPK